MAMTTPDREFAIAIAHIRRKRPVGYRYILRNQRFLRDAMLKELAANPNSSFFTYSAQLTKAGMYDSMITIARLSARQQIFDRPCCSEAPLTWPLCNASC